MGLRIFALFIFAVSLVSCSSYWKRKGCEKVNWFQHSYNVAMDGKRLDEDNRYSECKKVETEINAAEVDRGFKAGMANYCTPNTALEKGANGFSFNYNFCDGNVIPKLKEQHQKGIYRFCQPSNGYHVGSKGIVYNNQCSEKMEKAFLPKYRKGRQVYLKNQIAMHEEKIKNIDRVVAEKKQQQYLLTTRLAALPQLVVVNNEKTYDPATKTYSETSHASEDPEIKQQREQLNWEIRSITREIDTKRNEQNTLRTEIHKLRSELEGLKAAAS